MPGIRRLNEQEVHTLPRGLVSINESRVEETFKHTRRVHAAAKKYGANLSHVNRIMKIAKAHGANVDRANKHFTSPAYHPYLSSHKNLANFYRGSIPSHNQRKFMHAINRHHPGTYTVKKVKTRPSNWDKWK